MPTFFRRPKPHVPMRLYLWKPKPDITAYELAQAMNMIGILLEPNPQKIQKLIFNELPAEVQRHFEFQQHFDGLEP